MKWLGELLHPVNGRDDREAVKDLGERQEDVKRRTDRIVAAYQKADKLRRAPKGKR